MIDRDNRKVTLLSKNRDKKAVKIFLKKGMIGNDVPFMISTDRSGSNLSALYRYNVRNKEKKIYIRDVKYKNNRIEQDHRFIKKRINPMLGFKSMLSADNTPKGIEVVSMIQKNQYIH